MLQIFNHMYTSITGIGLHINKVLNYREFNVKTLATEKFLSRFVRILYHLKPYASLYDLDLKKILIQHFLSSIEETLKTFTFQFELNNSPRSEQPYDGDGHIAALHKQ